MEIYRLWISKMLGSCPRHTIDSNRFSLHALKPHVGFDTNRARNHTTEKRWHDNYAFILIYSCIPIRDHLTLFGMCPSNFIILYLITVIILSFSLFSLSLGLSIFQKKEKKHPFHRSITGDIFYSLTLLSDGRYKPILGPFIDCGVIFNKPEICDRTPTTILIPW